MFYSDTLLSKTGPLARVWLAANLERKLGKKDYVTANLENSIEAIVDQGTAPMALRLSGQLLLGVVRIYSRKAKYLLDDCNEALLKIKMAFRPGNVDLAADVSHTAALNSLTLPDALTELDLLAPMPDPMMLLGDMGLGGDSQDATQPDWGTQSLLTDSIEQGRSRQEPEAFLEDDGLELNFDDDTLPSMEVGRRARISEILDDRPDEQSKLYDDDLPLEFDDGFVPVPNDTGDIDMQDAIAPLDQLAEELREGSATPRARRTRDSQSPLSELGVDAERQLEDSFHLNDSALEASEDTIHEAQQQRVKRRKVLVADKDTEIRPSEIKAQQADRSKILKPLSFLPRDPVLLALMNMSKNGGFVSDILRNGRAAGWAPQLQDIMSIEVIRRSGELKRKRDSGVSDMYLESEDEDGTATASAGKKGQKGAQAQLNLPEDENLPAGGLGTEGDITLRSDEFQPLGDDMHNADQTLSPQAAADFDDTIAPLLHPAESGPISQGTRHAVYLLRDEFRSEDPDVTPSKQASSAEGSKKSVLFQDLLPPKTTTRSDATKMFFEVLVLATKDAIKVEQGGSGKEANVLGGPIRLRAKRGLWGAWAEESAGGQIEGEVEEEAAEA